MNDLEHMMAVLEGSCPDCSVDLEYKEYGGKLSFLKSHLTYIRDFVATVEAQLRKNKGRGTIGSKEYTEWCGKFSTVTGPGGMAVFQVPDGIDVTLWQDGDYEIGMIVTKCPECSKRYESYYHKNGDWTVV